MAQSNGNGERVEAKVGGQQVGIRSAYPVVLILLVCVVPLLTFLIQKERKDLVDQFVATLMTLAAEHRADATKLREQAEAHHQAEMARQLEIARAWLRVLGWLSHNLEVGPEHRLPFGAIPPGMEEQLKKQLPAE